MNTDPPYLVDYGGEAWDDSSQGAELYKGFIAAAVAEAINQDAACGATFERMLCGEAV